MNWTGGSLYCHSKQGKLNNKRSWVRKRKPIKSSKTPYDPLVPFRPDFCKVSDVEQDGPASQSQRPGYQTTLDHFDSFKPMISKLSSIKPRPRLKILCKVELDDGHLVIDKSNAQEPTVINSSDSSSLDDETYCQSEQRNHNSRNEGTIESKRQRLLSQTDWAGLRHTQPVTAKLRTENRSDFGKRRKTNKSSGSKTNSTAARNSVVPMISIHRLDDGLYMTGARESPYPESVYVKIGADTLQSGPATASKKTSSIASKNLQTQLDFDNDEILSISAAPSSPQNLGGRSQTLPSILNAEASYSGETQSHAMTQDADKGSITAVFTAEMLSDGQDADMLPWVLEHRDQASSQDQHDEGSPPGNELHYRMAYDVRMNHENQILQESEGASFRHQRNEQASHPETHNASLFDDISRVLNTRQSNLLDTSLYGINKDSGADFEQSVTQPWEVDDSFIALTHHKTTSPSLIKQTVSAETAEAVVGHHTCMSLMATDKEAMEPVSRASSLNSDAVWTKFMLDLPSDEHETLKSTTRACRSSSLVANGSLSSDIGDTTWIF